MLAEFDKEVDGKKLAYYLETKLRNYLDRNVKADLQKKDKDYVIIVDGYEGAGKSTFAQQIGNYVDPTLDLSRICMTAKEFKDAVTYSKPNQCVIYDEAVTGMSSSDSLRKVGRMLKSLMMQMRQKNLFVIVVMPYVFDFNKYAVLGRAKALFHVYERKGNRGYFVGYNKRDLRLVYIKGKKTYSYKVKSRFIGRFYGKYCVDEAPYRKKKSDALEIEEEEEQDNRLGWKKQRNCLVRVLLDMGVKQVEIIERLNAYGVRISKGQMSFIAGKTVENEGKSDV